MPRCSIAIPQLARAGAGDRGGLQLEILPFLREVNASSSLRLCSLDVQYTSIQDLSTLNLATADQVRVANNPELNAIDWPLRNCTNITITGNGDIETDIDVSLSELESAGSVSLSGVSTLSLESLSQVSGAFEITNTQAQFLLFPQLSTTGLISISHNEQLAYISFNALQDVKGPLALTNNEKLSGTLSFPALTSVKGNLNITGSYTDVQMQKIRQISGSSYKKTRHLHTIDIQETYARASCSSFCRAGPSMLFCKESKAVGLQVL